MSACMTVAECAVEAERMTNLMRALAADEMIVAEDGPRWLGVRLYYRISEDAYYAYDHTNGPRYFGKFRNDREAEARWRGWLRAGAVL